MKTESAREQMFSRRAFFATAVMGLTGAGITARMTWLSVYQGEKFRLLSEENRVQLRVIPPRRGWIIDRAGKPLALNQPDYRLDLIPEQTPDLEATLTAVTKVLPLTEEDLARIRADIVRQPKYMAVEIADGLDWQQFAQLNVKLPDVPGLVPVRGFARVYPDGERFAHLLGYVGTATAEQYKKSRDALLIYPGFKIGKDGIERTQDAPLRGTAGAQRVEVNARGRTVRELDTRSDIPGANLKLTIDRDLQSYAARRLGDESASVVVMDCETGDVLCLLSMPAFDPNVFSARITAKLWAELQASDHHPLVNKSVQGLYPPGSTFKMMTAIAALETGSTAEESCNCNGSYRLGNNVWHCWSKRGHGSVNMHKAIVQSCDVYFYTFGRAAGIDAIASVARRFGLGQKFDLPVPAQSAGIIPDPAWKTKRYKKPWGIGETLNTSIGQGYVIANPLQLAVMAARIASGKKIEPRLLADIPAKPIEPLGISAEHLDVIRAGMTDVVNAGGGTGKAARLQVDGIRAAGKTGSAQVRAITAADRRAGRTSSDRMPWKFRDHALFVAFAPADAPRYAISVIVEHGSHGGKAAAPIARDVLTYLFEPERAMNTLAPLEKRFAEQRAAREKEEAIAAAIAADPSLAAQLAANPGAQITIAPDNAAPHDSNPGD
jgi:penicillin-binding protein 2